jgi:hypothetical protein
MKKKPSPPLQSCSTTNSRRNRFGVPAAIAVLFLVFPRTAPAEEASLAVVRRAGGHAATIVFALDSGPERREPIEAGLKSRMVFTLQIVERRVGFFSFLGDVTLGETTVEYTGYKDFLEDLYVLEDAAGAKKMYASFGDFFRAFTRAEGIGFERFLPGGASPGRYVRVQVRYFPVKLVTPLTLIYVLSPGEVIESGWREAALDN